MSGKLNAEIDALVRNNTPWHQLPIHVKKVVLHNNPKNYDRYIFNYSLKNQLRFRGNIVRGIFRNEQRYYEIMIEKSIHFLCIFPYHLADVITKGLRVTPFNYYVEMLSCLLKNDKSYDTLPNFTAADCLRVLGVGRNEYLALVGELKSHTSKLFRKPDPVNFLPKVPTKIKVEPWWKVEVGYVLESDIKFVDETERSLIDDLIDFGSQIAGKCDYNIVQSLYKKGLIYLDVPINGEYKISIPPLSNFIMNRTSGDYFENLLYKIFVSTDEHTTISELSSMLMTNLDTVKQAVSLFCRLGFAKRKLNDNEIGDDKTNFHHTWNKIQLCNPTIEIPQITPLNFHQHRFMGTSNRQESVNDQSSIAANEKLINLGDNSPSSDENESDSSFMKKIEADYCFENYTVSDVEEVKTEKQIKSGKRMGFLFDSTLNAFLMMGNLSPGLKNHAVTMFEVGKLCDESLDEFLQELEKVSLLDAEGEGEVGRYFIHAVILRSTIIALRNVLPGGLDLLRLECLESLDVKTRDRLLEKKYQYIISASPLTASLTYLFNIPFFGQYYKSSETSHIWTKMFYYQISGYGPPSLFLCKGTILKHLPKLFLGYGKLLITIIHSDSYVICTENFLNLNEQLKNGCLLIQGYGINKPGKLMYEPFPHKKMSECKPLIKIRDYLDLENSFGYITFLNTGVADIGCDNYCVDVKLLRPNNKKKNESKNDKTLEVGIPHSVSIEDDYIIAPQNTYMSKDCNEILANELAQLNIEQKGTKTTPHKHELVSQGSIEITFDETNNIPEDNGETWTLLDVNFGVPLFDVDCNTRICEQISKKLCTKAKLNKITDVNNEMNDKFLKFVKQCLYFEDEKIEKVIKLDKRLPHPRINLAFENGKVCYWNGK